ncbi:MAG: peptidoglycan DD-metalloendopeptidase family protein [Pseudomonadota bacterium]
MRSNVQRGCAVLLAGALLATQGVAQDARQVEAELAEVRDQMAQINQQLIAQRAQQEQQQAALAEIERRLGQLTRDLRTTLQELDSVREQVRALSEQTSQLEQDIDQQQALLSEQLRVAYQLGVQSRVRALLSGQDPNRIARKLALHGYLSRSRLEAVHQLNQQFDQLDQLLAEQRRNRARLNQLQQLQQHRLAEQQRAQTEREQALSDIRLLIQTDEQRLANLTADANRLQGLLDQIANVFADIPAQIESAPFAELQGALPMPVQGRLRARYGDLRSGNVRWDGWLIGAEAGAEIEAIAYGRVAYSDWLRGYGLIMIIEHGDGYMSLYGHNQALLADVGDWVAPGQTIALVGNSGGEDDTGLYFQLRKDGDTINPARWVSR